MATTEGALQARDYVHLHNHTHYSLLDGLQKVGPMLDRIKELGMEAVAMTDHGTLSGTVEFYKEAKARGIKPIIGIETYVASRKHTDKDALKDKGRFHLILLAMNETGYKNLMRLSTIANLDGFYHKPRIDHDLLEQYHEGLICLSGCIGGEVGEALRNEDIDGARQVAQWYKNIFGDRYYFEVQDHGYQWEAQRKVNEHLFALSKELGIPCVVTCDAHYLKHEDQEAHEVLLCVQTGSFLNDSKRMSLTETDLYVTDPVDLISRWGAEHPEIISNTRAIADRCEVELDLGKILIPKFPVPEGEDEKSYLDLLVYRGLAWRYGDVTEEDSKKLSVESAKTHVPKDILERVAYELGIIDRMGFNGYFLIISDFIGWGKNEGIVFGPGRGSAAGSIVAYALKVTELDPMRYSLLFERFLNPDRISMPDVDIDIQDTRRDEVIQYCVGKYGKERVANIVTFGKMAARAAVRDVARVLQVPYAEADRLAKMVPPPVQGRHIPLAKSLQDDPDLKAEYENNPMSARVFDMAVRLEGTIRSHGVHAAGVVIAPRDIVEYAPLEMAQKGVVATQYSMGPIEELGLLKMDFLGLSNLTIIKNTLRIVKRVYENDIDINNIPLDDPKTFELLQRGDTTGVFQLESAGMKRYLRELKPTVFEDIIAMVALYRPGPMQWIEDFIQRKHGLREITYTHQAMEPALRDTYGVIVYQEQVMQISKEMCGFTGGQADTLRKAIGKKQVEVMNKLKKDFIKGAVELSGADAGMMEKFWKQLEDFAAYCFNKSHAACYALIAYQTAYLKAHYPAAFMAALMTSDYDDTDRLTIEISECNNIGIQVLPPDVNESFVEFAVVPGRPADQGQIRFGMSAVKNVGIGAVEEIIRARQDAPYESLEDFFGRVNPRLVNRKVLESLVKSGAMDRFGDRSQLLSNLDVMLAYATKVQKEALSGQTDLFGNVIEEAVLKPQITLMPPDVTYTDREKLQWERELMGLYLSRHPLSAYEAYLAERTHKTTDLTPDHDGGIATVGGIITTMREITTKNNQKMAFVTIADKHGEIEGIVFPRTHEIISALLKPDLIVITEGKLSSRDKNGEVSSEVKLIIDTMREITNEEIANFEPLGKALKPPKARGARAQKASAPQKSGKQIEPRIYVRLKDTSASEKLMQLKSVIDMHTGDNEVILVVGPDNSKQAIRLPHRAVTSDDCINALKQIVGDQAVVVAAQ